MIRRSQCERVRQPALRAEAQALADALLVARLELFDVEIDRRPPARELAHVAEDRRDLPGRPDDAPLAEEAEFGGVHQDRGFRPFVPAARNARGFWQLFAQEPHPDHVDVAAGAKGLLPEHAFLPETDALVRSHRPGHSSRTRRAGSCGGSSRRTRTGRACAIASSPSPFPRQSFSPIRMPKVATPLSRSIASRPQLPMCRSPSKRQIAKVEPGGVLAAGRPLDPVGFLGERHRVALRERRAERLVVHPVVAALEVVPLDRAQIQPLASDHVQPLQLQRYPIRR